MLLEKNYIKFDFKEAQFKKLFYKFGERNNLTAYWFHVIVS